VKNLHSELYSYRVKQLLKCRQIQNICHSESACLL